MQKQIMHQFEVKSGEFRKKVILTIGFFFLDGALKTVKIPKFRILRRLCFWKKNLFVT